MLFKKMTCTNLKKSVKKSSMKLLKNKKFLLEMIKSLNSQMNSKMLLENTTGKWFPLLLKKSLNS